MALVLVKTSQIIERVYLVETNIPLTELVKTDPTTYPHHAFIIDDKPEQITAVNPSSYLEARNLVVEDAKRSGHENPVGASFYFDDMLQCGHVVNHI